MSMCTHHHLHTFGANRQDSEQYMYCTSEATDLLSNHHSVYKAQRDKEYCVANVVQKQRHVLSNYYSVPFRDRVKLSKSCTNMMVTYTFCP